MPATCEIKIHFTNQRIHNSQSCPLVKFTRGLGKIVGSACWVEFLRVGFGSVQFFMGWVFVFYFAQKLLNSFSRNSISRKQNNLEILFLLFNFYDEFCS